MENELDGVPARERIERVEVREVKERGSAETPVIASRHRPRVNPFVVVLWVLAVILGSIGCVGAYGSMAYSSFAGYSSAFQQELPPPWYFYLGQFTPFFLTAAALAMVTALTLHALIWEARHRSHNLAQDTPWEERS
ncbi:hypothetical protein SB659_16250 [Arthrobacter sp. SIMBA_036]|uniref:hypothetical protein n=2 Tax=Bacteria TaxID=2 RepID=UPI00397B7C98